MLMKLKDISYTVTVLKRQRTLSQKGVTFIVHIWLFSILLYNNIRNDDNITNSIVGLLLESNK